MVVMMKSTSPKRRIFFYLATKRPSVQHLLVFSCSVAPYRLIRGLYPMTSTVLVY